MPAMRWVNHKGGAGVALRDATWLRLEHKAGGAAEAAAPARTVHSPCAGLPLRGRELYLQRQSASISALFQGRARVLMAWLVNALCNDSSCNSVAFTWR